MYDPPDTGQIRINYNPTSQAFVIEQAAILGKGGSNTPNDIAYRLYVDQEIWAVRATDFNIKEVVLRCLQISIEEGRGIRSVNFGPTPPQASEVQAAVDQLLRVIL